MIEKKEVKYVFWALVIAFIWMVGIIPNLTSLGISETPLLRFFIFNIGIFLILQVVLKSSLLNRQIKIAETTGLLMLANGIDLLAPPFLLSLSGELSTNILLSEASTDFIVGTLWQSMGVSGFLLYIMTYVVTPVLLFIGSAVLIKNFIKNV